MKKILIISIFVLAVMLIGYSIYYFFFKPIASTTTPPPANTQGTVLLPGQLPQLPEGSTGTVKSPTANMGLPSFPTMETPVSDVANGGFTKTNLVIEGDSKGVFLGANNALNYYDTVSGKFYKRLSDGTVSALSDKVFFQVDNAVWSKAGDKAILEYPDGSNIVYDFKNGKQYSLPKEMKDFSFSADGAKLAAEVEGPTPDSNWLVVTNSDGSNPKPIEPVGSKGDDVAVNFSPNNQVVATYRENVDADHQEIIFIGQNKENFKSITVDGRGFEGQWTPDGQKMLYSVYSSGDNFVPRLWITNAGGDNAGTNNVGLSLNTWADKCTISGDSGRAYCAVPRELPFGSGWYPELAQGQPDDFYEIDLATGRFDILAIPVGQTNYSAQNVFLAPDGRSLYFTNQTDGNVYSLNLNP